VLAGLSTLELHLFISLLHLHGSKQVGGAGSGAAGGGGGVTTTSTTKLLLVSSVLNVCDMLVEVFKQQVKESCAF
jgi:hypothetical protein